MIGNFNEISHPCEKFGERPANRRKMKFFNNFLNKANLIDLASRGPNILGLMAEN